MNCLRQLGKLSHVVTIPDTSYTYACEEVGDWNADKRKKKFTEICPVSTVDTKGVCTVFSEWVGIIKD